MLQKMREQARGVFGWIIIGAIILVMAIFGFGALNFFVASEPAVATVGDVEIRQSELLARVDRQRRQILASMGPDADASAIDEAALRERVLTGLIQRNLLLEGARDAGMGVPAPALDDVIVRTPEFRTDGRFDEDRFRIVLRSAGLTPVGYREALGEDLLVEQISSGVGDSAFVTDTELERMAALARQQRDVAWLAFDPSSYEDGIQVTEEEARSFHEDHSDRYRAPEQVSLRYLRLDRSELAAGQEITEEQLQTAYTAEVEAFEGQEQRRASHILLATGDERSEEDALALAEELRQRIRDGEDFEALAEEYSDDPGSADKGGDLGFATRDTYVPPFEKALFALEQGELSEPVATDFGVHLIRLEGVRQAEPPSFARMRPMLEERLRDRAAGERFDELLVRLETLAYEAPDLQEPAEELGLEIRETGPLTRSGGEGLFAEPEVVEAAFSRDLIEAGYNSPVLQPEEGVALVLGMAEHQEARPLAFEEVAEDVRGDLIAERAREAARSAADAAEAGLREGADASAVATESGRDWIRREGLERTDREAPAAVVNEAFRLPYPDRGERSVGSTRTAEDSFAVVTVTAVRSGDLAAMSEVERDQLERLVRNRVGGAEFRAFLEALRRDLSVSRRTASEVEADAEG
jgi:peptidyl-prolyl cis-trans isomerase D